MRTDDEGAKPKPAAHGSATAHRERSRPTSLSNDRQDRNRLKAAQMDGVGTNVGMMLVVLALVLRCQA